MPMQTILTILTAVFSFNDNKKRPQLASHKSAFSHLYIYLLTYLYFI
jgi:hypothetical protein